MSPTKLQAVVAILGVAFGAATCTTFNDTTPLPTLLSFEDAARLCSASVTCSDPSLGDALLISYGLPGRATSFSACMSWLAGPTNPARRGAAARQVALQRVADAAKNSCAKAGPEQCSCLLNELPAVPLSATEKVGCAEDTCVNQEAYWCAAGVRLQCGSDVFLSTQCSTLTVLGSLHKVACFELSCSGSETAAPECHDDFQTYCTKLGPTSGRRFQIDCGLMGLECKAGDGFCGHDECLPIGSGACTSTTSFSMCTGFGTTEVPCPDGYSCVLDGDQPRCAGPGEGCSPTAPHEACDGTKLSFCFAGLQTELDCEDLSLNCVVDDAGARCGQNGGFL